jgi:lysine-N-methylase
MRYHEWVNQFDCSITREHLGKFERWHRVPAKRCIRLRRRRRERHHSFMVPPELQRSLLGQETGATFTEPTSYSNFQCIGAACEDTCCEGWGVFVDKMTFQKYQTCSDSQLGAKLKELVTIKPVGNDLMYATIQSPGGRCSFLAEGLCSIQKRLGEDYLGHTCATYPRVVNTLGNSRERSLDLSCPEAARLMLLDPKPMQFSSVAAEPISGIRQLVISLLRNRAYPVSRRLILVGLACSRWSELESSWASDEARDEFLQNFATAVSGKRYDAHFEGCVTNPVTQLRTVLDLMVARLRMDYTSPRYRDLCAEFADGLQLKKGANWEEVGSRYSEAYRTYYAPFMKTHEHMLEHYLVAYAFKTMFPFGSLPVNRILGLDKSTNMFVAQYMLMASYFSIAKAVMLGLAARHKSEFCADHVVRAIQSISRTLEHCEPYPLVVLEVLSRRGICDCNGMAVLTQEML